MKQRNKGETIGLRLPLAADATVRRIAADQGVSVARLCERLVIQGLSGAVPVPVTFAFDQGTLRLLEGHGVSLHALVGQAVQSAVEGLREE